MATNSYIAGQWRYNLGFKPHNVTQLEQTLKLRWPEQWRDLWFHPLIAGCSAANLRRLHACLDG